MSKFNEILNSSDASDALLGEQIDALADKEHFTSATYTNNAANVYEYTGLSVTVPANVACIITAYDRYSNAAPTAICIANTSDSSAVANGSVMIAENAEAPSTSKNFAIRSTSGVATPEPSSVTYYVHVKRSAVGLNAVGVSYRKLN